MIIAGATTVSVDKTEMVAMVFCKGTCWSYVFFKAMSDRIQFGMLIRVPTSNGRICPQTAHYQCLHAARLCLHELNSISYA